MGFCWWLGGFRRLKERAEGGGRVVGDSKKERKQGRSKIEGEVPAMSGAGGEMECRWWLGGRWARMWRIRRGLVVWMAAMEARV